MLSTQPPCQSDPHWFTRPGMVYTCTVVLVIFLRTSSIRVQWCLNKDICLTGMLEKSQWMLKYGAALLEDDKRKVLAMYLIPMTYFLELPASPSTLSAIKTALGKDWYVCGYQCILMPSAVDAIQFLKLEWRALETSCWWWRFRNQLLSPQIHNQMQTTSIQFWKYWSEYARI